MLKGTRRGIFKAIASGLVSAPFVSGKPDTVASRSEQCFRLRSTAAAYKLAQAEPKHPINEDAADLAGVRSFSKALPHDELGEPLPDAYKKFVDALKEGTIEAVECIPLGGSLRLSNPLAENAFDLEGLDSRQFTLAAAPSFGSLQQAGEMAELYWQALGRDVPFSYWTHDAVVESALADLNANRFVGGQSLPVTPQTVFRLSGAGVADGPYVSQFLLLPVPYGALCRWSSGIYLRYQAKVLLRLTTTG